MIAALAQLAGVFLLISFSSGHSQESAAQRHELAGNHLKRINAEIPAGCLNDVQSLDDWRKQALAK
jgi:hypothetical protein